MRKLILCLFVALFALGDAYGQMNPDHVGLSWRKKLKYAEELMYRGSFYNAISYYESVFKEQGTNPKIAFRLAEAYEIARNYEKAENYYQTAFSLNNDKFKIAQYHYGRMLKMLGKYDQAYTELYDFAKTFDRGSKEDINKFKKLAKNEYIGAQLALQMIADVEANPGTQVNVRHFDRKINWNYTEASPSLRVDDKDTFLYFTTLRIDSVPVVKPNQKFERKVPRTKIYRSAFKNGQFVKAKSVKGPINGDFNAGSGSWSADGRSFYFTKCDTKNEYRLRCDIYKVTYDGKNWSIPEKLPFNDPKATNTHPIVVPSPKGDFIYFASNREGGNGGLDLYMVEATLNTRDSSIKYSAARNLGRRINTVLDEMSPFYDMKDSTLYFSSQGLPGAGGFDVFKSKGYGKAFTEPSNLGMPINSSVDDMFYIHTDYENGYLVSNRNPAYSPKWEHCCDDIFSFDYYYPPIFWVQTEVFVVQQNDTIPYLNDTIGPVDSVNVAMYTIDGKGIDSFLTQKDSIFTYFAGRKKDAYTFTARKPGHLAGFGSGSTVGKTESDTIYIPLYITPITTKPIVLRNLYYDLDKSYIREDAKASLDTVYNILFDNPNLVVEIRSHTDSRESFNYNYALSKRRADSAKAYLLTRGIPDTSIMTFGFGEDSLLNRCADGVPCSKVEHQLNRRTEFRIRGEVPGYYLMYDKREIEAVNRGWTGDGKTNQTLYNFSEEFYNEKVVNMNFIQKNAPVEEDSQYIYENYIDVTIRDDFMRKIEEKREKENKVYDEEFQEKGTEVETNNDIMEEEEEMEDEFNFLFDEDDFLEDETPDSDEEEGEDFEFLDDEGRDEDDEFELEDEDEDLEDDFDDEDTDDEDEEEDDFDFEDEEEEDEEEEDDFDFEDEDEDEDDTKFLNEDGEEEEDFLDEGDGDDEDDFDFEEEEDTEEDLEEEDELDDEEFEDELEEEEELEEEIDDEEFEDEELEEEPDEEEFEDEEEEFDDEEEDFDFEEEEDTEEEIEEEDDFDDEEFEDELEEEEELEEEIDDEEFEDEELEEEFDEEEFEDEEIEDEEFDEEEDDFDDEELEEEEDDFEEDEDDFEEEEE